LVYSTLPTIIGNILACSAQRCYWFSRSPDCYNRPDQLKGRNNGFLQRLSVGVKTVAFSERLNHEFIVGKRAKEKDRRTLVDLE
jgi:hypothetical protein